MAAPPGSPKGRHAGRIVIRVRKEDYSRKTAHVAAREVASYSVVRKALLGAVGTDHDLWWPQPLESARPGDDPWAVVLKDELAWRKKVPRRAIDSAEAWAACLAAWDGGARARYDGRARALSNEYAVGIEDAAKREEVLLCAWEFGHYAANARACSDPFLARVIRATEDPSCRAAALRAAWMLAEVDRTAGTRLLRHGLAERLLASVEDAARPDGACRHGGQGAVGCLLLLARERPAVRDGHLATERGIAALLGVIGDEAAPQPEARVYAAEALWRAARAEAKRVSFF